jgi:hypothetical protein
MNEEGFSPCVQTKSISQTRANEIAEPEMEALNRLVTDSLARHGFDRPVDPRRLQWSRWFRCDSLHSLLVVPSKPGIFAIAEEVMNFEPSSIRGGANAFVRPSHVGTAAPGCPTERSSVEAVAAEIPTRRLLAVLQFSEDDDMAYTLDRMFTRANPMRSRLSSGRCFLRYVVIEDESQRRSICGALNQWLQSSAEKASGIPAAFSSSLELSPITEKITGAAEAASDNAFITNPDSGSDKNMHCPQPLPSGF